MASDRRQRIIDLLRQLAASTQDQVIRQEIDGIIGEIDSLGGDVITVGDITGSTGVAIGRNIEMAINQYAFPEELVEPLRALLDELKPTVFLSYARQDDETYVERLYQDLVDRGFKVWWDRKDMPSRGNTFLQEIADAIAAADRLLAVCGPAYAASEVCRAELDHAHKTCTIINPLLRLDDYPIIPPDIAMLHAPDFRESRDYEEALEELLRILDEEVAQPGALWGVPSLPAHHLPRPDDLDRLSELVLSDARSTVVSSAKQTAALQGMGGVGKSVLAAAFARRCETRRAFPDGVFWLTIGQQPTEATLLGHMRSVGEAFGDDPAHYIDLNGAKGHLGEVLEGKVALLILDDVWDVRHAEAFQNALGPRCRMLVTTRDGGLATSLGAEPYRLDVLGEEAALTLLAEWSGRAELPEVAAQVADEVGNLPFALALCGAMVRDGTPWEDLLDALQEADLSFIKGQFPNYPYPDVLRALKVSIDALSAEASKHYHELAVFPEDAVVPEETIVMLWVHTNGLNARKARKLLTELDKKALLTAEGEAPNRRITLHDLNYDYLRAVMEEASRLHEELLAAYAERCEDGWPSGPDDGYFFQNLALHLSAAGREEELHALLLDFSWMQIKLNVTDPQALDADYDYFINERAILLVQRAIRLSTHVLWRNASELSGQLTARLQASSEYPPEIKKLVISSRSFPTIPHICALSGSLTPPSGLLARTFIGHTNIVLGVVVTPDGKYAISASYDHTLKIWNLATGQELFTLQGHTDVVRAVAVTPNGRHAISASRDHTLKIWDLATGRELYTLTGHRDVVCAVTVTPDGKHVISASYDQTVRVWDLATKQEIRTLAGHRNVVFGVAVTPDGKHAISASSDHTLKMWDIATGRELRVLTGHVDAVLGVVVTPDGEHAISVSRDHTLRVWDLATGRESHTLIGHTEYVFTVAVTPDGRHAISASRDHTLKIWDLATGRELYTLTGHTNVVFGVAVTPDGKHAISASGDITLKMWNLSEAVASEREIRALRSHTGAVLEVAVTPDGKHAISASRDHTLKVWDLATGRELRTLIGHTNGVHGVAVIPDGKHIISASEDRTLKVWDIVSGQATRTLEGHAFSVEAVIVTPNGKHAISASRDHTLKVWDIATGRELRTLVGHTNGVHGVAITPDGKHVISASRDHTLKVWDLATGRELRTLVGHMDVVYAVAVMPDGKHAISASYDQTVRIWDLTTGQELHTFQDHMGIVLAVSVTPNGKYAISVSWDKILRVWDLYAYEMVTSFTGESEMLACTIALDGHIIVAGEFSGQIHLLRLEGI